MLVLISGLVLFLGVHSIRLFANAWRASQIERMGEKPWKTLYSIASIVGFGLIVWGFGLVRSTSVLLWSPPIWTRHLAAGLMLVSFVLLIATYVPGNRIKARCGHPMLLAVKVWAVAHLLANGTLADILLFGAFLIWSVASFSVFRRRDRLSGVNYPSTGIWQDLAVIGIGFVAFALFAHWGHLWLIGVSPFK